MDRQAKKFNSPIRPLLVQHAMTTVSASDRLASLQWDILVAVAALVVDSPCRAVNGCGRLLIARLLGLIATVGLRGHGSDELWYILCRL